MSGIRTRNVVQYTRAEKQATPKATFAFRRENEQSVCEADNKHKVRDCECFEYYNLRERAASRTTVG